MNRLSILFLLILISGQSACSVKEVFQPAQPDTADLVGYWLISAGNDQFSDVAVLERKADGTFSERMITMDRKQKIYEYKNFPGTWKFENRILTEMDDERGFYAFEIVELSDQRLRYVCPGYSELTILTSFRVSADYKLPDPPDGYTEGDVEDWE